MMQRLTLEHADVRFGSVYALEDARLEMEAGDVTMLAGPNGAGKSTLMQVLLGLVRAQRHALHVDGKPRVVDHAFKQGLGYLPEAVAFADSLTGRQVLRFFAMARDVPGRRVEEVLRQVGLADAARRAVRGYSRGMRQRLGLAVAILARPPLLVLDEPTGGLDQEGLSVLWSVLEQWRAKGGMVLLSSHDLTLLERRVDRISVLRDGRVLATDSPDGLRRSVDLPTHVRLRVDPTAEEELLRRLREALGQETNVACGDGTCSVQLAHADLVRLLDASAQLSHRIHDFHVEEPGLDAVYEQLLRNEA